MTEIHPFISYLTGTLAKDRGALAALRRGLGQPPGHAPEMLRFVVPFLSERPSRWEESTLYLIASLFGLHPANTTSGNMGDHYAALRTPENKAGLERRFTALLAAHPDDLHVHLRQAVARLKSEEIPVNWNQLFWDCRAWNHPEWRADVRRRWAKSFWREPQASTLETE
ncbi:MAG TPA: type I-E CRISPR-associated protein Cse2/CasB [Aggregatilineales bacterium]|nr:type I-E CRISPR-associated protein Cse2/CasB [Aggregatilineales bacterium]HQA68650.1 type I-E CRISPR-associated protein Cse2/CasB [Aggregatilineales bacterium]HQE17760.1 type I-E CRISPR-associated protein Cse2/CasB [Aggregatilineales bacterium]